MSSDHEKRPDRDAHGPARFSRATELGAAGAAAGVGSTNAEQQAKPAPSLGAALACRTPDAAFRPWRRSAARPRPTA